MLSVGISLISKVPLCFAVMCPPNQSRLYLHNYRICSSSNLWWYKRLFQELFLAFLLLFHKRSRGMVHRLVNLQSTVMYQSTNAISYVIYSVCSRNIHFLNLYITCRANLDQGFYTNCISPWPPSNSVDRCSQWKVVPVIAIDNNFQYISYSPYNNCL